MNAIIGFSELLNRPGLPEEKISYFTEMISRNSNQLLSIITDIINISAIEAGQEEIVEKDINIHYFFSSLVKRFEVSARKKNLELQYIVPRLNEDIIIRSDETKLLQIFINLINNAIKFTEQGSVKFGYSLKSGFIEFFVRDTGTGIPEDKLEKIFERFFQVHHSISDKSGGTGLGLSISKAYVELLGGEIRVESVIGEGSVFYFTVPYKISENAGKKGKKEHAEKKNFIGKQKTLLIAEDEDNNFFLLEEMLDELNLKIIRAVNGVEAIEICKNDPSVNLVLMDIKMPVLNGDEATAEIKKFRPGLPVIAQTAYALDVDRNKILESGCDEYIEKPIEFNILMGLLKKYLGD